MFLVMIVLAVTLGHLYLWKRLIRDTLRPGRGRIVCTVLLVLLTLLVAAAQAVGRELPPEQARWLAWPGYLWLGVVLYLVLALAALEIPRLVIRLGFRRTERPRRDTAVAVPSLAGAPDGGAVLTGPPSTADPSTGPGSADVGGPAEPGPDPVDRRLFLGRAMAATAGVVAVGTVGYGVRTVLAGPVLKRVTVPLRGLHPDLDGYRVAVVSDIHAGATAGRSHVERIVSVINEARADIVAIVGDLEDGSVSDLRSAVAPLRDIASSDGAYFVTGNHEYFGDWRSWMAELPRLGVTPLRNERTAITRGAGVFDLAGVNDVNGARAGEAPDFGKALDGRDTTRPVVLMAHQPVQVTEAAAHGVDLQVSGHTHGGQMWPFHYVVQAAQPSLAGLSQVDRTWLYVTRGAGYWGPPVRVGAPPDVTVITLSRG